MKVQHITGREKNTFGLVGLFFSFLFGPSTRLNDLHMGNTYMVHLTSISKFLTLFLCILQAAALFTLLFIIVINLAIGMLPHVDNFAHIGGFLTGFLLGFILLLRPQFGWLEQRRPPAGVRLKSKYKAYQYVLWIVSAILLIVG